MLRCATSLLVLALASAGASGCGSNPTQRCVVSDDCNGTDACYRGFCIASGSPRDASTPDTGRCPPGQTACGPMCVNLFDDRDHCGDCETRCRGSGQNTCAFGHCVGS